MTNSLLIGKNDNVELNILPALANRHGLITGATGTGKTVTLQKMAEEFSRIGVPVFMADVKGDLSGIGVPGVMSAKLQERLDAIKVTDWKPTACPLVLWDVFGEKGHPVRATISDMGPLLLARLLNLNDVQHGVLQLIFKIADDNALLLLDIKDLRSMVRFVGENAKRFTTEYGNVSTSSIGAIQRSLLTLEQQGAEHFFCEPMLDIFDLIKVDTNGQGVINILTADKLYKLPKLYSIFLLWLLSELFEHLPEVGDIEKPKVVFFFDEAHLLFNDAPLVLLQKIEQVVRLIRSKGVGVYFVTQSPSDIPDTILGQLSHRVQHALRAFTPRDQKAVKAAAQTMRANSTFDVETAISELAVGEALISFLDAKGQPNIVERGFVIAPHSRMGTLTEDEINAIINNSPFYGRYEEKKDRLSAYEKLAADQIEQKSKVVTPASDEKQDDDSLLSSLNHVLFGSKGPRGGKRDEIVQTVAKSMGRQVGNQFGRQILRGVLGGIMGGSKKK